MNYNHSEPTTAPRVVSVTRRDRFIPTEELSRRIGLSVPAIMTSRSRGRFALTGCKIPGVKGLLWSEIEVDAWIEALKAGDVGEKGLWNNREKWIARCSVTTQYAAA